MRLIVDPPMPGSRNMAIDQALLQSAAEQGVSTFRIYQWIPATVSLGYFQNHHARQSHAASLQSPLVRRASGGGAIVHDIEMTYSLALPANEPWANSNRQLFDEVHQSLINCLESMGVEGCRVYQNANPEKRESPFLCFQRRANGDVVIGDDKVIGSAQRRLHDALLQHGSVLVGRSKAAPELPGILELSQGADCSVERLVAEWPSRLAKKMGWTLTAGELSDDEELTAKSIESSKFGSDAWNLKR